MPRRARPGAPADEEHQRFEQQRNPAGKYQRQMRQMLKSVGHESENDPGDPGDGARAGHRPRQPEGAVTREKKTEKSRDAEHRQRLQPEREQRKEEHGDAIVILSKRQRVLVRIKDCGVEEVARVVKGLMIIPPEKISVRIRIAFVGYGIAQVQDPWPGHCYGQDEKAENDQRLAT